MDYINLKPLSNMLLSGCKKCLHSYRKAQSSHATEILDSISGLYFPRIVSVKKLLVLHLLNSFKEAVHNLLNKGNDLIHDQSIYMSGRGAGY